MQEGTSNTDNDRHELAHKRLQIPLVLAWAISIHKAQGLEIEQGAVRLEGLWENGMAYVALSRFKQLQKAKLITDASDKTEFKSKLKAQKGFQANQLCLGYYESLQ